MATLALQLQSSVVVTETPEPATSKIFTLRFFINSVWFAGPLSSILIYKEMVSRLISFKTVCKTQCAKSSGTWEIASLSMEIVSDTPWAVVMVGFLCMSFCYYGVPLVGLWRVMLLVSKTSLSLPLWRIWLWGFGRWKVSECDMIRGFTFTFVVWLNSWASAVCQ